MENSEIIESLDVILEANILSEDEKEFIYECKADLNPVKFLTKKLAQENLTALSIYGKLENLYNDINNNNDDIKY